MECPFCGHSRTEVYNSRNTSQSRRVWRRRRCRSCHKAFTTYETSDLSFMTVQKKDGRKQPYMRSKLIVSLSHVCMGMDEHLETVDALTDTVEDQLVNLHSTDVSTSQIASIVLVVLKRFHTKAYVRYLSYRSDFAHGAQLKEVVRNVSS